MPILNVEAEEGKELGSARVLLQTMKPSSEIPSLFMKLEFANEVFLVTGDIYGTPLTSL